MATLQKRDYEEKIVVPKISGFAMLATLIIVSILLIVAVVLSATMIGDGEIITAREIAGIVIFCVALTCLCAVVPIFCIGFKIINPNEALVLLLFGKYVGTIISDGFFWINPFCASYNPAYTAQTTRILSAKSVSTPGASKKLSLKAMTLNNEKQKVNDEDGNPIEIGVVVIWKIINTAKAVFNVDNYTQFVSTQADAAIRQVARKYPYDVSADGDEKSLRGSTLEISQTLCAELQDKVAFAGIEILEAKIAHLAYAPEIAAAMLQRQQASAIISARQKIVEGAVGMVEMAINKLSENKVCNLDDERKAAMVSNLLVVLCGNRDAQPIVNSGSIY